MKVDVFVLGAGKHTTVPTAVNQILHKMRRGAGANTKKKTGAKHRKDNFDLLGGSWVAPLGIGPDPPWQVRGGGGVERTTTSSPGVGGTPPRNPGHPPYIEPLGGRHF